MNNDKKNIKAQAKNRDLSFFIGHLSLVICKPEGPFPLIKWNLDSTSGMRIPKNFPSTHFPFGSKLKSILEHSRFLLLSVLRAYFLRSRTSTSRETPRGSFRRPGFLG